MAGVQYLQDCSLRAKMLLILLALLSLAKSDDSDHSECKDKDSINVSCSTPGSHMIASQTIVVCPSDCSKEEVHGSDIYTDKSSICGAAFHSGIITERGGAACFKKTSGIHEYHGTTRNQISSLGHGPWYASFVVTPPHKDFILTVEADCITTVNEIPEGTVKYVRQPSVKNTQMLIFKTFFASY
ncbi:vitrin-like [Rana temporaria]|uniref:vitrin-like n=1 Tax=Rana temporaria TaxID=8407 RepID=UPI001AADAD42|nr:vitrin-like [Rana temporaria]